MNKDISTKEPFELSTEETNMTSSEMLLSAVESETLPELLQGWINLGITCPQPLSRPMSVKEIRHINKITSIDDLNEDDFKAIDSNLSAAKAYAIQIGKSLGVIADINFAAHADNKEKRKPVTINAEPGDEPKV